MDPSCREVLFKVRTFKNLKIQRSLPSLNAGKKFSRKKHKNIQLAKTITVKEGNENSLSPKHSSTPQVEYFIVINVTTVVRKKSDYCICNRTRRGIYGKI